MYDQRNTKNTFLKRYKLIFVRGKNDLKSFKTINADSKWLQTDAKLDKVGLMLWLKMSDGANADDTGPQKKQKSNDKHKGTKNNHRKMQNN